MQGSLGLLAVQFSTHDRARTAVHHDWWQVVLLLGGVALLVRGLLPVVRAARWRAHALSPSDGAREPGGVVSWSLIVGVAVVGGFLVIASA